MQGVPEDQQAPPFADLFETSCDRTLHVTETRSLHNDRDVSIQRLILVVEWSVVARSQAALEGGLEGGLEGIQGRLRAP
jgi:hypothetical protein